MKAEECKLSSVFADSKTYEIPNYQRPYSWLESHTQDLINDTIEAFENSEKEYFIGSVITIEKEKDHRFEITDGQQRLTTLIIILAKLRDLITAADAKLALQGRIMPINALTGASEKPRLHVREQDRIFFIEHILAGNPVTDLIDMSVTQRRFLTNSKTAEGLFEKFNERTLCLYANFLLENVYVVFVKTENFQSAYRLFNVLNARGMSLSNADLIKNKLFDITAEDTNHDIIKDRWNDLEELISIPSMDAYFSHYRTSIKGEKQQFDLNKEYERYLDNFEGNSIEFLDQLISSARKYNRIIKTDFDDPYIKRVLSSLHKVSHDEWIPPLLCFMNRNTNNNDLKVFIKYLDKITYQNWIRRLGKTQRNTVYYNVIGLINKGSSVVDIIAKIKEYKNNEEFTNFISGDIYGAQYASAVLLRIEQELQDISVTKSYNGNISIEHVLPQKLSDIYWKERFTDTDHKNLIHKLGNLTLLSGRKNSAAQNYDFDRKRDIYNSKNKKVSFDLTKEVCDTLDWTKDVVEARHIKLVNIATEIWNIN
ncbi:Uncharacterized conserved protein, contains ParB-like and HNH nuclease domains [Chitinophaga sp. CF118]|uniref:DUF262 domain-containing protein n=1 Tax=Chitinophaga sp. CF118 TaxID=1884367 RepID=UPI0008DFFC79|nr:DUF262 domain-containing protein [Chitinophaga sp. CF118]SFE98183.1 Uncharacterized conserved protein, contains ParB-like and HNH nuclease domains [Chitinophaga sp. CF118]